MERNADFNDLLRAFDESGVRYLLVGAHAVTYYAEPRFTKDMDVWVEPTMSNAGRVYRALVNFGAPVEELTEEDLQDPELVYQIGVSPNRIDIMMGLPGVRFETAWRNRRRVRYGQAEVNIIGRRDLIRAKRAAGRPQDMLDVANLLKANGDESGRSSE